MTAGCFASCCQPNRGQRLLLALLRGPPTSRRTLLAEIMKPTLVPYGRHGCGCELISTSAFTSRERDQLGRWQHGCPLASSPHSCLLLPDDVRAGWALHRSPLCQGSSRVHGAAEANTSSRTQTKRQTPPLTVYVLGSLWKLTAPISNRTGDKVIYFSVLVPPAFFHEAFRWV